MANMMRCGIRLFTLKHSKQAVPRVLLSSKYQRLCFHTSWVLDVKGKELSMPALSPTMENGTIVKWLKKEGDLVSPGDVIADIQTDKAVMSLETEDEFILAKIIIPEGKNAKIGDLIAVTVEPGEDWKSVEMPDGASNSTSASSASTPSAPPPPAAAAAAAGPVAEPPPGQTNVSMPSLSPTMESGTIVKWLKKEGDSIEPGDAVAEIQTDKAVMTFEMEDEGILAKILAPEGSQAKVGDLIAIVVEKDFDKSQLVVPGSTKAGSQPAAAAVATPAAAAPAPQATIQPPPSGQNNISMPSLSPTMETGTIVKWLKKEGDSIEPGDGVADIQTDKAVMTFEMEEEGILAKILAPEGTQASIGDLIAIIVEKDFDLSNLVIPATTKAGAPAAAPSAASATTAAAPAATTSVGDQPPPSGQVYGLAVRRLLEEYGLSSGSLKGTGRGNRLLKEDVLNYINQKNLSRVAPKPASVAASDSVSHPSTKTAPTSTPTPTWSGGPSTFKDVPVSNIRAVIAKRLGESKSTIPHSFASIDINIDKLTELRSELRVDNIKVSVNDFITKAVGHALVECPSINTLYQNGKIVHKPQVDVSIAVSTPSGLITPIVFNAAQKGLKEIADDIRTLAGKARDNKLQPQEFQGGTFTISNLGMFGIKNFSAIINPPQTAILAVGTGREVLDLSMRKTTLMTVTLSYDSRAIDEFQASDFLTVLQSMLQNPGFLAVNRPQIHRRERN